ncbi:hypothetical protein EVAR_33500_1 [Eumeta japonica]|uniref:Uncharacterized protein n=1 Tax=Eumeta variegata TaxID=151549 RepID=A0A4C1WI08_EUMVA|nr:hypothetical protein EVAR_33500_1 [Eumeta japonica]
MIVTTEGNRARRLRRYECFRLSPIRKLQPHEYPSWLVKLSGPRLRNCLRRPATNYTRPIWRCGRKVVHGAPDDCADIGVNSICIAITSTVLTDCYRIEPVPPPPPTLDNYAPFRVRACPFQSLRLAEG